MSMKETIERAENHLLHTYNRYPIVFDHADGVRLYDADGKEYLDFAPVLPFMPSDTVIKNMRRHLLIR